jgi:hypothetical protein
VPCAICNEPIAGDLIDSSAEYSDHPDAGTRIGYNIFEIDVHWRCQNKRRNLDAIIRRGGPNVTKLWDL